MQNRNNTQNECNKNPGIWILTAVTIFPPLQHCLSPSFPYCRGDFPTQQGGLSPAESGLKGEQKVMSHICKLLLHCLAGVGNLKAEKVSVRKLIFIPYLILIIGSRQGNDPAADVWRVPSFVPVAPRVSIADDYNLSSNLRVQFYGLFDGCSSIQLLDVKWVGGHIVQT